MDAHNFSETAQNIISQAPNWNFEGDCMILQWMEQISQTLEERAKNTTQSLDQLTININRAQIDLENTQNSVTALQYSQYVEMRCQEETASENENVTAIDQQQQNPNSQEVLQVFLQNNMKMLHNCHDKFSFLEESDEDEDNTAATENCIYQPRNPYNERLLPHIYGTKIWKEQGNVGLEDETNLDYSGDEKSEVYSVSSKSSSTAESGGRESPESHLTANTSQWTSSASLNSEFIHAGKTTKAMPSLSNTPSLSSLPLDITNNNKLDLPATVRDTSVPANIQNPLSLQHDTTLQTSNSIKKKTLNLFDDNDYKNLISEVVEKTQSLDNSKSIQNQAKSSKIDLFASDESLPTKEVAQPQNNVANQKVSTVNLFDSPTEPVNDFFEDFQQSQVSKQAQPTFIKTKLSGKNLFEDDDEDEDFLNIFAKKSHAKSETSASKQLNFETPKPLFGNDELDRQEIIQKDQIAVTSKTLDISKNVQPQNADRSADSNKSNPKPTKSLFFDDNDEDDDFFAKALKTTQQPTKSASFPAYLCTEPPEDEIGNQKDKQQAIKEKSFEVDFDADDDFENMFSSKKSQTQANSTTNLFADNEYTQFISANITRTEQNRQQKHPVIVVAEKTEKEKARSSKVETSKPIFSIEKDDNDDDFEQLFRTKNQQKTSVQTKDRKEKELDVTTEASVSEGASNLGSSEAVKLSHQLESKHAGTDNSTSSAESQAVKIDENFETKEIEKEGSSIVVESKNKLSEDQSLKTTEPTLKLPFDEESSTNKTKAVDLLEAYSQENSYNSSVSSTVPPLDEPYSKTAMKIFENSDDDDEFLSNFNKKNTTETKMFDKNEEKQGDAQNETQTNKSEPIKKTNLAAKNESLKSNAEYKVQLTQQQERSKEEKPNEAEQKSSPPKADVSKTLEIDSNSTAEAAQNSPEVVKPTDRHKTPIFDSFSPLFLDEPPDDDDFLQTISNNSSNVAAPNAQYSAENDFYEPSVKQSLNTDTKTEEGGQQIHTGYNIRLFDELPPDDNEEDNENVEKLQQVSPAAKPNTLSNLFAADESFSLPDKPPAAKESPKMFMDILTDDQFEELPRSVTSKVQDIEKPSDNAETPKAPSPIILKLKLPKIDINVQALLPNAGGKTIKRNVVEVENVVDELPNAEKKPVNEARKTAQSQSTAKANYANEPDKAHLLPSLCKSRVRVPVKRKSSTRAGRQESYRQTMQAESKGSADYQANSSYENSVNDEVVKVKKNINQPPEAAKLLQQKSTPINTPALTLPPQSTAQPLSTQTHSTTSAKEISTAFSQSTSTLIPPKSTPTSLHSETFTTKSSKQSLKTTSQFFVGSIDNEDDDDDFFSKLAQPEPPTIAAVEKSHNVVPKFLNDDSDDDLFASNVPKGDTTLMKPKTPAINQAPVVSKSVNVSEKPIEQSTKKGKPLFDSDSSNEDENFDDLFKTQKSSKHTFQTTTKAPIATNTAKSSTSQKIQTKTKSLFSDSDDDDDDLFGGSSSQSKNKSVGSSAAPARKYPLGSQQQKPQKEKATSHKTADNPLADLLN